MNGGEYEYERCVKLYLKSVYTTALYYLKNKSDADDVTQNVFLKLYTHGKAFNDETHLKAWLLRCAINESKNLLRSHWYRYSKPLEEAEEIAAPDSPEDGYLLEILDKLNRNNRIALYMYYYEGYSTPEIAKILGISENAVSMRLRRGRKQLKSLIENGKEQDL